LIDLLVDGGVVLGVASLVVDVVGNVALTEFRVSLRTVGVALALDAG
jgi:hypothetical protein